MRQYSITRNTMEWNRLRCAIEAHTDFWEAPDYEAVSSLVADITQMLKHDNAHRPGMVTESPSLPERVEKA